MRTNEEVTKAFSPVEKLPDHPKFLIQRISNGYKDLAQDIVQNIPESADRTAALRQLLVAKHMTVQAISHNIAGDAQPKKEAINGKKAG